MSTHDDLLRRLRHRIDGVDKRLVQLLNRRARLSLEVAQTKCHRRLPVYSQRREQEVLARLCSLSRPPLDVESLTEIYRAVFRASRRVQKRFETMARSTRRVS